MPEIDQICVSPDASIKTALKVLNEGHLRIVLIVDDQRRLLGVAADSDFRRAVLSGTSFDSPVSEIMVKHPIVALPDTDDGALMSLMQRTKCYEIPIVDCEGNLLGLRTIDSLISVQHPTEVVIMAGGRGERLLPLTKDLPKPLVPVGGKPILFILLDTLICEGFTNITLTLNYKADMIRDATQAIAAYRGRVRFIEEPEARGTAGALSLLDPVPGSPFLVMNADLLTKIDLRSLLNFHRMEKNHLTMAVREEAYSLPFGVVELKGTRVLCVEEKPVYRYFANAGIYVVDPSLVNLVPRDCFYDMTELINAAAANGRQVGMFPVHEYWLDIGEHGQLAQARKDLSTLG